MKNFTKYIQNCNALHRLWERGDTIVVSVSGGRDSMCLAHVLLRIACKENLRIIVAHVNHGLRSEDSLRDQQIVEGFCKKNDVSIETLVVPDAKKGEDEAAWRNLRRTFLARVATKYSATSIALGHHRGDHAETLLLHLMRGSGLQGLSNMRFRSAQILETCPEKSLQRFHTVIRPLLNVSKQDITTYCKDYEIDYGEDESNHDILFLRNKVRHALIPYLEEHFNQNIVTSLARSAQIIADDYSFLSENVELPIKRCGKSVVFSRNDFTSMTISAQRFYLRRVIVELTGSDSLCGFGMIEEFRKALLSEKNKHRNIQTKDLIFSVKNATVEITLS